VVVDPTGRRAWVTNVYDSWVTNVYDSTVFVIDLPTRATVATIKVGKQPNGISYAPRPPASATARMSVVLPTPSAAASGHADHGGHG
jgi:YVTN family beta-propeller protein